MDEPKLFYDPKYRAAIEAYLDNARENFEDSLKEMSNKDFLEEISDWIDEEEHG